MKKNNILLFVHDSLPSEGISGMIVFLRHFIALKNWDIYILIPENAYRDEIVKQYPNNFHVHTFPVRLFWWPTFREDIPIMVKIRIWVLSKLFKTYINKIQPDILITVQYHYYSVAIAQNAIQSKIPLISFLHDRWDLTSNNPYIQGVRKHYAQQTLLKSSHILSVTKELVVHYLVKSPAKAEVFFPIPSNNLDSPISQNNLKHLIYAGTVEDHHLSFFAKILPIVDEMKWQLSVISNRPEKLKDLAHQYACLKVMNAFTTNNEALNYIKNNAGVILVNYGLSEDDNPYAFHSFPSKFVEYCGLDKPILAVAPAKSPFHQFLTTKKWIAFIEDFNLQDFKTMLDNFSDDKFYQESLNQVRQLRADDFNPIKIQAQFEKVLMDLKN